MSARDVYTGDGSQTSFQITFPYLRIEDVKVYVDGLEVEWTLSNGFAVPTVVPANGTSVIVMREQGTEPLVTYAPSNITARNMNTGMLQALYAIEDAVEGIAGLSGQDGASLPLPVANDKILVSRPDGGGGFSYQAFDLSEILPVLGDIPSPVAGPLILATNDTTDDYELVTPAELLALLGGSGDLPVPVANQFLQAKADETGYQLASYSTMFSGLGLGTSARKNTGVATGQVVVLEDVSGNAGLPAVDGSQLTGISGAHDYAVIEGLRPSGDSVAVGTTNVLSNMESSAFTRGPAASAWVTEAGNQLTLQPGRYKVSTQLSITEGTVSNQSLQATLDLMSGVGDELTSPVQMLSAIPSGGFKARGMISLDGIIEVTEAAVYELKTATASGTYKFTGSNIAMPFPYPTLRMTIEKLA